jgi:hypothetical protein
MAKTGLRATWFDSDFTDDSPGSRSETMAGGGRVLAGERAHASRDARSSGP